MSTLRVGILAHSTNPARRRRARPQPRRGADRARRRRHAAGSRPAGYGAVPLPGMPHRADPGGNGRQRRDRDPRAHPAHRDLAFPADAALRPAACAGPDLGPRLVGPRGHRPHQGFRAHGASSRRLRKIRCWRNGRTWRSSVHAACSVSAGCGARSSPHGYGRRSVVVGNGVRTTAQYTPWPDHRDAAVRSRLLPGGEPFVLAIGGVEARKNTLGTVACFPAHRARAEPSRTAAGDRRRRQPARPRRIPSRIQRGAGPLRLCGTASSWPA